jgi:hypothetical protein
MGEMKTYTGGCHCGKVRYEVTTDLSQVVTCNCSRCAKLGWMMTFVKPEAFKLLQGRDALTEYRFNTKQIQHLFCATCGIESFSQGKAKDGSDSYAVSLLCVDDLDTSKLTPYHYDGKKL